MKNVHYIYLGSKSLIYIPSSDVLYEVPEKFRNYKFPSYTSKKALGSLGFLLILFLFRNTILSMLLYINVFECLMLSVIVKLIYQYSILSNKIYTLLKDNPKKIEIKYSKPFFTQILTTTKDNAMVLLVMFICFTYVWINIDKINFLAQDEEIIARGVLILLFCLLGYASATTDILGRIKLLYRLKKDKQ